ncbi:alpha-L-fucosidase [Spartobacteria bacterium LR76]|nr:alpha-L-fucosidase [Spartobacteria bacterium LR76]
MSTNRLVAFVGITCILPHLSQALSSIPVTETPGVTVSTSAEPIMPGKFQPTWESLSQYQCPEWFRDAKFGIWAHWGPQCQPAEGDWYARHMYVQGHGQYKAHLAKYGHPSEFGFKDVINEWKAEKWEPEKLVALYKRMGAKYFFAMANHHDNFDMWDSKYQPWNSAAIGPKKDIIAGWAKAAKEQGLPFGVSVHAAHAWSWYETAQASDKDGPKAGVPYDGKLTKADGKGKWWDGLDPQDLYEQRHEPSRGFESATSVHARWNWGGGISQPDQAYCDKFYNRTAELIRKYQPDLIYFDDTALPLWPVSDAGLKIAADFYNTNLSKTGGKSDGVLFGKVLDDQQLKCLVWDIERGVPNRILPYPWQTDTCLGGWHYNKFEYERNRYKSAKDVIHMLADIVSKNGNLLLNVPVRGDGTIDEKEEAILEGIAAWMNTNQESIFATRPWKVFGEGPASAGVELKAQGFNEGKGKPFTAEDIRFTVGKDGSLYAIVCGRPSGPVVIKSLGKSAALLDRPIAKVEQLGTNDAITWSAGDDALTVNPVVDKLASDAAVVFKIQFN